MSRESVVISPNGAVAEGDNSSSSFPILLDETLRNWGLVVQLVRREVEGRYRGSFLGIVWSFIAPLFMLGVYTFVFGYVFQSRWSSESLKGLPFPLVLFSGLMIFGVFAETVTRASSAIVGNPNYIKRVVFPLQLLPVVLFGSALVNLIISLSIFFIAYLLTVGFPPPGVLLLPLVILPLVLLTLGVSWFLASLGVFLRDISQVVPIVVSALLFLSPIFYPASAVPSGLESFYNWNLIGRSIEDARTLLFTGVFPHIQEFLLDTASAALICVFGYYFFQRTRKGFADVL
jgi:lipopolysaccharide transport system permease protein